MRVSGSKKSDETTSDALPVTFEAGRRLRHGVVGREPVGWAVPQAQDPSSRSAERRDPPIHRLKPLRDRRHLGRRRTLARHLGRQKSELRRIDPQSGEVLEQLDMPAGTAVSGLESNGSDTFFCGGASSAKLRVVRRPESVNRGSDPRRRADSDRPRGR